MVAKEDPVGLLQNQVEFGRYEPLFRIAAGGMAEVYAARVSGVAGFEKLVAVKRMLPQLADDEEFVTMFLDEAKVAAHINSPHVVQTLELGQGSDNSLYIAMELVVGVTLARLLRWSARNRYPIPIGVAVNLLWQASQGLHDAHEATTALGEPLDVVHRDVSPQNILVGVNGRVRLTDFGVAKAMRRATRTEAGRIKGKYAYCAPEHITGKDVDRRADVFSLGVVAWEFFTGQRLFLGDHPAETIERVRTMPIPALHQVRPDVPQSVSDAVSWALERDLTARAPTALAFGEALRAAALEHQGQPEKEEIIRFVRSAGGEALHRLQDNIVRALKDRRAIEALQAQGDLGLTPTAGSRTESGDHPSAVPRTPAPGSPAPGTPPRDSTRYSPPQSHGSPSSSTPPQPGLTREDHALRDSVPMEETLDPTDLEEVVVPVEQRDADASVPGAATKPGSVFPPQLGLTSPLPPNPVPRQAPTRWPLALKVTVGASVLLLLAGAALVAMGWLRGTPYRNNEVPSGPTPGSARPPTQVNLGHEPVRIEAYSSENTTDHEDPPLQGEPSSLGTGTRNSPTPGSEDPTVPGAGSGGRTQGGHSNLGQTPTPPTGGSATGQHGDTRAETGSTIGPAADPARSPAKDPTNDPASGMVGLDVFDRDREAE